jgi:hypothetical protein
MVVTRGRFTPGGRIRKQPNSKQRQMFQRAVQSYAKDNFRERRVEVGRLSIYKHSTQDCYHLVTTFKLKCAYEEIRERDRQTNMNGFLFQQHRPIFSLNPESYISIPRDMKTGQHSQLHLHPVVSLHMDGYLHLFFGRSNLFLLPTGMCAGPNFKIRASLMLTKRCAYVYKRMTSSRYQAMEVQLHSLLNSVLNSQLHGRDGLLPE